MRARIPILQRVQPAFSRSKRSFAWQGMMYLSPLALIPRKASCTSHPLVLLPIVHTIRRRSNSQALSSSTCLVVTSRICQSCVSLHNIESRLMKAIVSKPKYSNHALSTTSSTYPNASPSKQTYILVAHPGFPLTEKTGPEPLSKLQGGTRRRYIQGTRMDVFLRPVVRA